MFIRLGTGDVAINGRTAEDYFPREILRMHMLEPLRAVEHMGNFDMFVTVPAAATPARPARSATASRARCRSTTRPCARR